MPTVVGGGSTANTTSSPTPAQAQQQEHATTTKKGAHHRLSKGFLQHPDHKALLPIELKDVALFLLSFMVLGLAAGAGIGGGVLLVPMLSLITGFNPIQVWVSKCVSKAAFVCALWLLRHPHFCEAFESQR